ncbi:hypothetical protein CBS101457_000887 [Exobasidium rhododendri]|nr:hypothetical protein CBS101457_000887 [Exobasidium rhododendri]
MSESPLFTPPSSPTQSSEATELLPSDLVSTMSGPEIPGLFYFPGFIISSESEHIVQDVINQDYFDVDNGRDQAVLFGSRDRCQDAGLPSWTHELLSLAASRLREAPSLPPDVLTLLFPDPSLTIFQGSPACSITRQLILNCYQPGQGISSHIDLPNKFLDGIMIFSFGSGIAMTFQKEEEKEKLHSVYLMPCSLCVLSGESRWEWSHGIPERTGDWVQGNRR